MAASLLASHGRLPLGRDGRLAGVRRTTRGWGGCRARSPAPPATPGIAAACSPLRPAASPSPRSICRTSGAVASGCFRLDGSIHLFSTARGFCSPVRSSAAHRRMTGSKKLGARRRATAMPAAITPRHAPIHTAFHCFMPLLLCWIDCTTARTLAAAGPPRKSQS